MDQKFNDYSIKISQTPVHFVTMGILFFFRYKSVIDMKSFRIRNLILHLLFFAAGSCITTIFFICNGPLTIAHSGLVTRNVVTIVRAKKTQSILPSNNIGVLKNIGEQTCVCNRRIRETLHNSPGWIMDQAQREDSLKRFKRRRLCMDDVYNFVDGNSPISYPAHGLYVRPLRAVLIKGLRIEWFFHRSDKEEIEEKVQFSAERGVIKTLSNYKKVRVEGNGTKNMTIKTRSKSHLNLQLQGIVYENTDFDTNIFDKVLLQYLRFNVTIPIHIQHRQVPWLYRKGTIEERVTVIIKTFLRYHKARSAINSIQRFYPGLRVILADDTPRSEFTNMQHNNVHHYRMPGFT
ncbi:beta-1,4 N-acetylgalactosaminyltransferase 2-like isoform X2 [Branchiostoma floridae]|nr:beta-1,4 N-acetylgalactosaminyltransferase 2-like isoform X2 [Branchiostoma floridae]